jgi:glyoxalase family protein
MGLALVEDAAGRKRFAFGDGGPGRWVDIVPAERRGLTSAGTVHHVAWRTPDELVQLGWQQLLMKAGHHVSPVMDRNYFRSIYYREPGGVLFEIATDPPGFAVDESPADLGTSLRLPPWMEASRESIRGALPSIQTPAGVQLP